MKRFIKRTLLTIAVLLGSSLFMAAAQLILRKAVETPISDITLCLRSISFGVLLAYGYRMSIHIWKRAAWLDKLNKRIHNTLLSTGILTLLIFAGGAIISNLCTQVMNAIYEEVISMHMRLYLMALCGIGSLTLAIIAREIPTNGDGSWTNGDGSF